MPADLSQFPHLERLVQTNAAYRQAWLEGRFPPPSIVASIPGGVKWILAPEEQNSRKPVTRKDIALPKSAVYGHSRPAGGPGTEASLLLKSIGINPTPGCLCAGFARQMDVWGPTGCRQNFVRIVEHFRKTSVRYSWAAKIKAALLAVTTRLAFKLNPLDPFPGIVEEAIRRAEAKREGSKR